MRGFRRFWCFGLGVLLVAGRSMGQEANPTTDQLEREIQALQSQVDSLKEQLHAREKNEKSLLDSLQAFVPGGKSAPTANVPDTFSSAAPTPIADVGCRGKLGVDTDPLKKPLNAVQADHCGELSPLTRLAFENLAAGVTGGYTNIAGSQNIGAGLPVVSTSTSTYRIGIGWVGKPIVRQLRSVFFHEAAEPNEPDAFGLHFGPEDETSKSPRLAVTHQGSAFEDLVVNPWVLNATIGYGKTLQLKDGDRIEAAGSRPSYSATLSYVVDLERLYVHVFHGQDFGRPTDSGYYFAPGSEAWWHGRGFPP